MSPSLKPEQIHGEWMGFLRVSSEKGGFFHTVVDRMVSEEGGRKARMHDLVNRLVQEGERVRVLYTTGNWIDIDTVEDLVVAGKFI